MGPAPRRAAHATAARGDAGRTRRANPPGRVRLSSAAALGLLGSSIQVFGQDHAPSNQMSKPSRNYPRPLSDLLGATLGDVLKKQGFASTEIVSRWEQIVGAEIA